MIRFLASIVFCIGLCLSLYTSTPAADKIKVAFITPADPKGQCCLATYVDFMKTAADNLGIDLEIITSRHRFDMRDKALSLANRKKKPDYAVHLYFAQSTPEILPAFEKAGIKSVIVTTDVVPSERASVGFPQRKYKLWIGHIFPDDLQAGRELAERLFKEGVEKGLTDNDRRLHIIGIGGTRDNTAALFRKEGLLQAVHNNPKVVVDRFVRADWLRGKARHKARALIDDYPDARVFWSVHSDTALGILDAAEHLGIKTGTNFLTGCIDWLPETIKAVREGRMEAAVGGHFMDGAWALIMILDHSSGAGLAEPGPTLRSRRHLIDRSNLEKYLPLLNRNNWEKIDFKRFSKTYNPSLKHYDFSPDAVLRQLNGK